MAMKIPTSGLPTMLKDGYKHLSGVEEAVFRNIKASKELTQITRTSYGPNGRNKMILNHLQKLFITSSASTIIKELDVIHPAAKLIVMAAMQQQSELGDGTNWVVVFAGELLGMAENLIRLGVAVTDVIEGFRRATILAEDILESNSLNPSGLSISSITEYSKESLLRVLVPIVASKQYGQEELLSSLIADAVLLTLPKNTLFFNVDSIRIVKILGGSIHDSSVVKGMVFGREAEGDVKACSGAKVAVFTCGIDVSLTETKGFEFLIFGTVLLHNASELLGFSQGEEMNLDKDIKALANAGVNVVVTGSGIGELALHFLNRYKIMVIKVLSKFDIRRLCQVINATALTRLGVPTPEEMGSCDFVESIEIGSDWCTVFRQDEAKTKTATIVLRGSTTNSLDDLERAIDNGVNCIKAVTKDSRLVPGAGAVEIEIAQRVVELGEKISGIHQYGVKKFGEAFEVVPRTLAENAGFDSTETLSLLYASHASGRSNEGVIIDGDADNSVGETNVVDLVAVKKNAIRLAAGVACTILSVDQIIMSKPAGGPKANREGPKMDDD